MSYRFYSLRYMFYCRNKENTKEYAKGAIRDMRSTKKLAFLDRFYKRFCCGAKNHPSGWKKQKKLNQKAVRRRLKSDLRVESEE